MMHAQHEHGHRGHDHAGSVKVPDPVCGMKVDPQSAAATFEHEGVKYYFCCQGCRTMFQADPAKYLAKSGTPAPAITHKNFALVVHDRNETVATKHTKMMRSFHKTGTLWTQINHIVDTPLFVDSSLTRMVQMADVCAWGLRRFCENAEIEIFKRVFARADRLGAKTVGLRHYTGAGCKCEICITH